VIPHHDHALAPALSERIDLWFYSRPQLVLDAAVRGELLPFVPLILAVGA
jgi:hypothetical protein